MEFGGDEEEANHFGDVMMGMAEYVMDAEGEIQRKEHALQFLPPSDFALLQCKIQPRLTQQRVCARANQHVFNEVIGPFYTNLQAHAAKLQQKQGLLSSAGSRAKARGTLHQISREWSSEGREERAQCFDRITQKLKQYLPHGGLVALPGCGLSRLCVDLAHAGYQIEGSEFSYQMLLVGDYIMNRIHQAQSMEIFPWIDQASNLRDANNVYSSVRFPDIVVDDGVLQQNIHIVAGEFVRIYYNQPQYKHKFDAVVFCFFLDTASNLCEYLRVLRYILKPGGIFMSFGPLQWHFQPEHGGSAAEVDERFAQSVELTFQEVKELIEQFGFKFQFHEQIMGCSYSKYPRSMLKTAYDCEFFVATRVGNEQ